MSTEKQIPENIAQTVARLMEGHDPIALPGADENGVVALPADWALHDMEKYLEAPRHTKVQRKMATLNGFANYVAAHVIKDRTAIYVDHDSALAVIDDISREEVGPAWAGHRATLPLSKTREWEVWSAVSGKFQPQREFVDFIQDRAGEIATPPLADLVQELQAMHAEITGSRRDKAGHLNSEAARQMATQITNKLPEYLDLSMPILKCEPDQLTLARARLSFKLPDDGVMFAATLVNPGILMDARIREFVARLDAKLGNKAPVYF